jgi:hypothetical protein
MKTPALRANTWIPSLALLAVLAFTGCAASRTVKAPETEITVTKDASKQDLLAAYNKIAAGITTLNLSVDLVPSAVKT